MDIISIDSLLSILTGLLETTLLEVSEVWKLRILVTDSRFIDDKQKNIKINKRDEFMSDSKLNERMDDACMAEIRLGIAKMDFKKVGDWGRLWS